MKPEPTADDADAPSFPLSSDLAAEMILTLSNPEASPTDWWVAADYYPQLAHQSVLFDLLSLEQPGRALTLEKACYAVETQSLLKKFMTGWQGEAFFDEIMTYALARIAHPPAFDETMVIYRQWSKNRNDEETLERFQKMALRLPARTLSSELLHLKNAMWASSLRSTYRYVVKAFWSANQDTIEVRKDLLAIAQKAMSAVAT